jgi:pyrroline-5-carboxylate reductase
MAGDWIVWTKGLTRKLEVVQMARTLQLDRRIVACLCMEVWEWADAETTDGEARGAALDTLDAVTGLAGSGPAFVYVVIEALSDAGVQMGLPRNLAAAMAARTVRGAAEMVLATGEHQAVLKDRVASPGGTTIAGLQALEVGGLRASLMAAVEAATRRSVELGTKN